MALKIFLKTFIVVVALSTGSRAWAKWFSFLDRSTVDRCESQLFSAQISESDTPKEKFLRLVKDSGLNFLSLQVGIYQSLLANDKASEKSPRVIYADTAEWFKNSIVLDPSVRLEIARRSVLWLFSFFPETFNQQEWKNNWAQLLDRAELFGLIKSRKDEKGISRLKEMLVVWREVLESEAVTNEVYIDELNELSKILSQIDRTPNERLPLKLDALTQAASYESLAQSWPSLEIATTLKFSDESLRRFVNNASVKNILAFLEVNLDLLRPEQRKLFINSKWREQIPIALGEMLQNEDKRVSESDIVDPSLRVNLSDEQLKDYETIKKALAELLEIKIKLEERLEKVQQLIESELKVVNDNDRERIRNDVLEKVVRKRNTYASTLDYLSELRDLRSSAEFRVVFAELSEISPGWKKDEERLEFLQKSFLVYQQLQEKGLSFSLYDREQISRIFREMPFVDTSVKEQRDYFLSQNPFHVEISNSGKTRLSSLTEVELLEVLNDIQLRLQDNEETVVKLEAKIHALLGG